MEIGEIIGSLDFALFLIVGIVVGGLYGQFIKGANFIQSIVIGVIGSVISGFVFDWLNFMDIGDYADPIIAGSFGAVILLAIAWVLRGKEKPPKVNP